MPPHSFLIGAGMALLAAVSERCAECAKLLTDAGAKVEARSYYGETPLIIAARHGDAKTVSVLLHAHAAVNARDLNGNTPLMASVSADTGPTSERIEVINLLTTAGADLELKDNQGRTVFQCIRQPWMLSALNEAQSARNQLLAVGSPAPRSEAA